jgi:CheY-like chemotaxis protein
METKSCLFIDNNMRNRMIFCSALEYLAPDSVCLTASNGDEGLSMLLDRSFVPDFILIENDLPSTGAKEFLSEIKQYADLKELPVIAHCTSASAMDIFLLRELGAYAIYVRPYSFSGICNLLTVCCSSNMAWMLPN